jgi:hypothetical protein
MLLVMRSGDTVKFSLRLIIPFIEGERHLILLLHYSIA